MGKKKMERLTKIRTLQVWNIFFSSHCSEYVCVLVSLFMFILGLCKEKKFKKSEITIEVGAGLTQNFFFGKSSKNSPKPVLIYWSSISCVFCLYIHC